MSCALFKYTMIDIANTCNEPMTTKLMKDIIEFEITTTQDLKYVVFAIFLKAMLKISFKN